MPTPSVGDMAHGKAHGMDRAEEELVEAIRSSGYLDQHPAVLVAHGELPSPDGDVEPALVELAEAHDAALERRDEVDVRERPMVTPVAGEDDGPAPWMSTTEPSTNRTFPVIERSSSANASTEPVMWFEAPVSRNQPSLCLSGVVRALSSLRKT